MIEGLSDQTRETEAPGAGYVLAFLPGCVLVGKLSDDGRELYPVYEFKSGIVRTQQGPGLVHTAMPVCMLPSLDSFNLPAGTPMVPLVALSAADQKGVMGAVREGEEFARGLRMSQAGIVPAGAMPKNGPVLR